MNLNNFNYKDNYKDFIDYLYSFQDLKYKNFHSKLILDNNLIGIRMPILQKIAKEISKTNYQDFFKYNKHNLYEEKMIHGLILGYLKVDFKQLLGLIDTFIPFVDNWAINDCFCANLKAFKNNQEEGYKYIINLLKSKQPFQIRVGLVLLLDFYVDDKYINKILKLVLTIDNTNYYVSMANAWLISICYIKYPETTYDIINKLDIETKKRTIRKIFDSKRVSDEYKNKFRV